MKNEINQDRTKDRIRVAELILPYTGRCRDYSSQTFGPVLAFGPGDYDSVIRGVSANGKKLPSLKETFDLFYSVAEGMSFFSDYAYDHERKPMTWTDDYKGYKLSTELLYKQGIFVPVINVWTPKSYNNFGRYGVFDENGEGLSRSYSLQELEDRLSGGITDKYRGVRVSRDEKVTFFPFSRRTDFSFENDPRYLMSNKNGIDPALHNLLYGSRSHQHMAHILFENTSNDLVQTTSLLKLGIFPDSSIRAGQFRLDFHFELDNKYTNGVILTKKDKL